MVKVCKKCKELKPIINFLRFDTSKDGYKYICKACKSEYEKERYGQEIIPEFFVICQGHAVDPSK
jgi:protein-arginine kinase activator protein McsA